MALHRSRHRLRIRRSRAAWSASNVFDLASFDERLAKESAIRSCTIDQRWTDRRPCIFVLSQVPAWLQKFLYLAGGLFVLYLAYGAYQSWKNFEPRLPSTDTGTRQTILKAALTNALAPGAYIFWTLVTGPILIRGWRETPWRGVSFLLGFYITMILSLGAIIIVFGLARQLGPKVNRVLLEVSALALLCFGLYQLWLGITR